MKTIKKTAILWTLAALSLGIVACGDDDSGDKCSYTAAKCNADGSALLRCVNGREVEKNARAKTEHAKMRPTNATIQRQSVATMDRNS